MAYRLGFAPQDLHGNINVSNNTELLAIKDFFPPATPVFTNLKNGDGISTSIFTIEASIVKIDVLIPSPFFKFVNTGVAGGKKSLIAKSSVLLDTLIFPCKSWGANPKRYAT